MSALGSALITELGNALTWLVDSPVTCAVVNAPICVELSSDKSRLNNSLTLDGARLAIAVEVSAPT